MKFENAVKCLREGLKVRRPSWKEGSYWKLGTEESIQWTDGRHAHIHLNQVFANDFEIYNNLKEDMESRIMMCPCNGGSCFNCQLAEAFLQGIDYQKSQ